MDGYASYAEWQVVAADNPEVIGNSREQVERALLKASRDLDAHLGWEPPTLDELRINTASVGTDYQVAALKRATCEQASYRLQRGEADATAPDDGIASIGGISFRAPPPRLGPEALAALTDAGIYLRSGLAPEVPEVESA